jgi:excisionase family DNA binding protein
MAQRKSIQRLSVKDAARRIGVSEMTVRRIAARGEITHYRVGKSRLLFDEAFIESYLSGRLRTAQAAAA